MTIIIDADYNEEMRKAHVAGILCSSPLDDSGTRTVTAIVHNIEEYCPGQFYRRELKCVDAILSQLDLAEIELVIVDGFADFGTEDRSLGTYVFDNYHIPVIGIAKNPYAPCKVANTEVCRGTSARPLFVTAKGMPHAEAKKIVRHMAGDNRLPILVKIADKCARDWNL